MIAKRSIAAVAFALFGLLVGIAGCASAPGADGAGVYLKSLVRSGRLDPTAAALCTKAVGTPVTHPVVAANSTVKRLESMEESGYVEQKDDVVLKEDHTGYAAICRFDLKSSGQTRIDWIYALKDGDSGFIHPS